MREVELKAAVPDHDAVLRRVEAVPSCSLAFAGRIEDQRFDTPDRSLMRRDEVLRLRVMRPSAEREAEMEREIDERTRRARVETSKHLESVGWPGSGGGPGTLLGALRPGPGAEEVLARLERMQQDSVSMYRLIRQEESETRATLDWKGPTTYEGGYKVRQELSTPVADADAFAQILGRLGFVVTMEIDREVRQYALGGATIRFERYPRMDVLVEVEGEPEAIERAIGATGLPRDAFTADRLSAFVSRFEARTGQRAALSDRALRGEPAAVPYSADDA